MPVKHFKSKRLKSNTASDRQTYKTPKKSSQVSLVLLGVGSMATLTACDQKVGYQYDTLNECKKDWGMEECIEEGGYASTSSGLSGGSGYAYYYNTTEKKAAAKGLLSNNLNASAKSNAKSVKRGGFGRVGRAGS